MDFDNAALYYGASGPSTGWDATLGSGTSNATISYAWHEKYDGKEGVFELAFDTPSGKWGAVTTNSKLFSFLKPLQALSAYENFSSNAQVVMEYKNFVKKGTKFQSFLYGNWVNGVEGKHCKTAYTGTTEWSVAMTPLSEFKNYWNNYETKGTFGFVADGAGVYSTYINRIYIYDSSENAVLDFSLGFSSGRSSGWLASESNRADDVTDYIEYSYLQEYDGKKNVAQFTMTTDNTTASSFSTLETIPSALNPVGTKEHYQAILNANPNAKVRLTYKLKAEEGSASFYARYSSGYVQLANEDDPNTSYNEKGFSVAIGKADYVSAGTETDWITAEVSLANYLAAWAGTNYGNGFGARSTIGFTFTGAGTYTMYIAGAEIVTE